MPEDSDWDADFSGLADSEGVDSPPEEEEEEEEELGGAAPGELDELEVEPELPQPAATSATSTTLSATSRRAALFLVFSNVVLAVNWSSAFIFAVAAPLPH